MGFRMDIEGPFHDFVLRKVIDIWCHDTLLLISNIVVMFVKFCKLTLRNREGRSYNRAKVGLTIAMGYFDVLHDLEKLFPQLQWSINDLE